MKKLLLGDEAIAQGAIDAGLSGVYAYPGTPSTEITEYIQGYCKKNPDQKIHNRWCTNEKTAMEAALGMSFAGKRALVCMKHVGMNVAADPFVNSSITGVNGGLIVLVADDPSMHSSQDEQDTRYYGKFALIPVIEPSSQQEAYDMMSYAYDLSESLKLPVLMRTVTRLAHSRAVVSLKERRNQNDLNPVSGVRDWVLLPAIAKRRYASLLERQPEIMRLLDPFGMHSKGRTGIVDTRHTLLLNLFRLNITAEIAHVPGTGSHQTLAGLHAERDIFHLLPHALVGHHLHDGVDTTVFVGLHLMGLDLKNELRALTVLLSGFEILPERGDTLAVFQLFVFDVLILSRLDRHPADLRIMVHNELIVLRDPHVELRAIRPDVVSSLQGGNRVLSTSSQRPIATMGNDTGLGRGHGGHHGHHSYQNKLKRLVHFCLDDDKD